MRTICDNAIGTAPVALAVSEGTDMRNSDIIGTTLWYWWPQKWVHEVSAGGSGWSAEIDVFGDGCDIRDLLLFEAFEPSSEYSSEHDLIQPDTSGVTQQLSRLQRLRFGLRAR